MSDDTLAPSAPATRAPAATESVRHRWMVGGANAVVALALAGSVLCVSLLGARNARLRQALVHQADSATLARRLSVTLTRNIQLTRLAGTVLPPDLVASLEAAAGERLRGHRNGMVVMAYTSMSCRRALEDGLRSLRDTAPWHGRGVGVYALLGQRSSGDRERAVFMRADGAMTFPFATVSAPAMTAALFPPDADSTFDEEPLYLWLSPDFTVRSAFHADQFRPELLDAWLGTIR
jgi:hypothetical protein